MPALGARPVAWSDRATWLPLFVLGLARGRRAAHAAAAQRLDVGAADEVARRPAGSGGPADCRRTPVAPPAHRPRGPAARIDERRRADRHRLAEAGRAAAGERAGRPRRRTSSKRSSRTSSRTSAGTTTSSTCCRRSSRRCCSITRRSGGCRAGFAPSARTAATISPSACAAIRSRTRRRSPSSKSCVRQPGDLVLAATGGSLLQRVRRLLGAPSHAGRAPGWLAAGRGAPRRDQHVRGGRRARRAHRRVAGGRTGGPGGARGTGAAGKHAPGRCRRSPRAARAIRAAGGDRCRAAVTARAFRRGSAFRTGVGRHDADGSSTGRHSADGSGTARHNADGSDPGGPIRRRDLAIAGHARRNRADAGSARGSGNPSAARSRRGGAGCGRSSGRADRLVCELAVHVAHDERW